MTTYLKARDLLGWWSSAGTWWPAYFGSLIERVIAEFDRRGEEPPDWVQAIQSLRQAGQSTTMEIEVHYRNHRGAVAIRHIKPIRIWYGPSRWHPEPQWLLDCYDKDKGAERTYALRDCDFRMGWRSKSGRSERRDEFDPLRLIPGAEAWSRPTVAHIYPQPPVGPGSRAHCGHVWMPEEAEVIWHGHALPACTACEEARDG